MKLESVDGDINLNSFIDKLYSISDNEILIESFKDNYKRDRKNLKNFNKFLGDLTHIDNFLETYKSSELKNLFYFISHILFIFPPSLSLLIRCIQPCRCSKVARSIQIT